MLNVMIVDDDRNLLRCLQELIPWNELGCREPVLCHNGKEALEEMKKGEPDLLISDLKMPVMDGITFCGQVRKKNREVEIIFLSAYEDFAAAQRALQFRVRDYILKPLCPESLTKLTELVKLTALEKEKARVHRKRAEEETEKQIKIERKGSAVQDILSLVERNYQKPELDIGWIAGKLHFTPSYVGRIFMEYMEISLIDYISAKRMEKACELLEKSELPIGEIAGRVGYENSNYFTKVFRTRTGKSPSEYRKIYYREKLN